MSDFSLMDAIECGIVKLPRVPVADNIPGEEMPTLSQSLGAHSQAHAEEGPRQGRKRSTRLSLPVELQTALEALYGHYEKTFDLWQQHKIRVPPCFIVVCNNTSRRSSCTTTSRASTASNEDGPATLENGRLPLFRNFDGHGNQLARPRTLLIDSEQLESGEALDEDFRGMAADEIERFRREIVERTGDQHTGRKHLRSGAVLREVMNTVGRTGQLGESIRCVVSVSMLTEGWDANTVTHVLGVRAFGTQLLCEQVIGRALAPPVLRAERGRALQRRICRYPRHPV